MQLTLPGWDGVGGRQTCPCMSCCSPSLQFDQDKRPPRPAPPQWRGWSFVPFGDDKLSSAFYSTLYQEEFPPRPPARAVPCNSKDQLKSHLPLNQPGRSRHSVPAQSHSPLIPCLCYSLGCLLLCRSQAPSSPGWAGHCAATRAISGEQSGGASAAWCPDAQLHCCAPLGTSSSRCSCPVPLWEAAQPCLELQGPTSPPCSPSMAETHCPQGPSTLLPCHAWSPCTGAVLGRGHSPLPMSLLPMWLAPAA